jgi:hypothetical protein
VVAQINAKVSLMVRLKLFLFGLLLVLVISGIEAAAQVPGTDAPSWVKDLGIVGYPSHSSEKFSKTFGTPPMNIAFADPEHLVVTFISSDPDSPHEQEGSPVSFRLRLHIVVVESRTGEVDTKRDWLTPNPNDGVVAGHDGKVVVRDGNKLTVFDTTLKALKETDTAPGDKANGGLFAVFASPRAQFLLLEFRPGIHAQFTWMNADSLEMVHSFSDSLYPQTISDTEVAGWRLPASRPSQLVIRIPDGPGREINPPDSGLGPVAFVREDTLALESGYSPIRLIRGDGTLIESITPHTHEFFSRITPCAEGHRFAFTGSTIRNASEILEPHQTWEYVQRVHLYDMSARAFVGNLKVSQSERNPSFPLALSPDGSMLAFRDGHNLKLYRLPLVAEFHP